MNTTRFMKAALIAFIAAFTATLLLILSARLIAHTVNAATEYPPAPWWTIQSVDTMKYSRDISREIATDASYDSTMARQMRDIAALGATHVGIATPYDEEFVPVLTRWVNAARSNGLRVWFRGNFSGWEQWFEYPRLSREEHLRKLPRFIKAHPELFAEGDIFTPCPECENGGPGDPRRTGDAAGHRTFLIDEYTAAVQAFRDMGKGVHVGYFSMNYDVAKLIMNRETTSKLGGTVTIDHYVRSPKQLIQDVRDIAEQSGGQVYLGEFGAPIPDIHGDFSDTEQAAWVSDALTLLAKEPAVVGVNYWVNMGGSTQLWTEDGKARPVTKVVKNAFMPKTVAGVLRDQFGSPIRNAKVTYEGRETVTGSSGQFILPYVSTAGILHVMIHDQTDHTFRIEDFVAYRIQIIENRNVTVLDRIIGLLNLLFR